MEKMLTAWLEKGLINKNQYLDLLCDINIQKEKSRKITLQITMYIIGALLLGLGIFLFISANDWLLEFLNTHNFIKIFLMFLLTLGLFQGGYYLKYQKNKFQRLGFSLIFLSCLSFGGLIALIGQIYNMRANYPSIYFIWFLAIYPLAFIFKSKSINILSCVVFILSAIFYFASCCYESDFCLFIYLPFVLGCLFYSLSNIKFFEQFSQTYKNIGLFAIFILLLVLTFSKGYKNEIHQISYLAPAVIIFLINLINFLREKSKTLLFNIEFYSICALILYILTIPYMNSFFIQLLANIFIIFIIASMYIFNSKNQKNQTDTATKFLTIYLITTYFRFFSQYLKGALFYIIAGIILLAVGIYLEKIKKGKNDE